MDTLKIGIVGLGYWGPKLVEIFKGLMGVEMICDLRKDLLSESEKKFGIPGTVVFEEMLERVDAVVLTTPPATHFPLAQAALERGKHVFVEKPLATSYHDAKFLTELAKKQNLVLFVDHTFSFDQVFGLLRKKVEHQEFGKITQSAFEWLGARPKKEGPNVLWDSGPHAFSALYYLLGKLPQRIIASPLAFLNSGVLSALSVKAEFQDNTHAEIFLAWKNQIVMGKEVEKAARVKLIGTDLGVVYEGSFGKRQAVCEKNGKMFPLPGATYDDEPLRTACQAFLDAVLHGKDTVSDGAFGSVVVSMLDASERSLKEGGAWVHLN